MGECVRCKCKVSTLADSPSLCSLSQWLCLSWSPRFARMAGVDASTVSRMEACGFKPVKATRRNLDAVLDALLANGVEVLEDGLRLALRLSLGLPWRWWLRARLSALRPQPKAQTPSLNQQVWRGYGCPPFNRACGLAVRGVCSKALLTNSRPGGFSSPGPVAYGGGLSGTVHPPFSQELWCLVLRQPGTCKRRRGSLLPVAFPSFSLSGDAPSLSVAFFLALAVLPGLQRSGIHGC